MLQGSPRLLLPRINNYEQHCRLSLTMRMRETRDHFAYRLVKAQAMQIHHNFWKLYCVDLLSLPPFFSLIRPICLDLLVAIPPSSLQPSPRMEHKKRRYPTFLVISLPYKFLSRSISSTVIQTFWSYSYRSYLFPTHPFRTPQHIPHQLFSRGINPLFDSCPPTIL